ncbi:MAG: metallophosphoesterase [Clostridiales bacterium]|nr:metallophosphoesterase [Clostridiales bacterium]
MTFSAFFTKAAAFLLSVIMTLVPYAGFEMPTLNTKYDDCLFNMEMVSDVHIEADYPFRTGFLKQALRSFASSKVKVNAVVSCGDLTNYADEPSLAKYYKTIEEYSPCPVITVAGNHDIGHAGDRNKTSISREEALQNVIKYYNDYSGRDLDVNYYATDIDGYRFIVLGDEVIDGGKWDGITMSEAQLEFLDTQLSQSAGRGKPVFVCCHWPIENMNGENTIWQGSGIERSIYDIPAILEKYENVFYISGHMHGGVRCVAVADMFNIPMAECVNGVTYISLPTFGIINMFGIPVSGTGAQLEVYSDKVVFRPKNYLTGKWYTNAAVEFSIK